MQLCSVEENLQLLRRLVGRFSHRRLYVYAQCRIELAEDAVAWAGPPLKLGPIADCDRATPAPDDLAAFQFFELDADSRAIGADDLRERVMGDADDIRIGSVLHH